MYQEFNEAIYDLTWYFQSAESDCGERSSFGGFEAQMTARAKCEPARDGQIHVRETRSSKPVELADRFLQCCERARQIQARLAQLTHEQVEVLDANFSDVREMGAEYDLRVSVGLAVRQRATRELHAKALERVRKVLDYPVAKSGVSGERGRARRKRAKEREQMTPVGFIEWLAATNHSAVQIILNQARVQLVDALKAYVGTKGVEG